MDADLPIDVFDGVYDSYISRVGIDMWNTLLSVSSLPVNVRILAMLKVPQLPSHMQFFTWSTNFLRVKSCSKFAKVYAANVSHCMVAA